MVEIGNRLRAQRIKRGFETQKEFWNYAKKCHGMTMPLRRYGAIERGDTQASMLEIRVICHALEFSADQWLFGSDAVLDVRGMQRRDVTLLSAIAGFMGAVQ